MKSTYYLLKKLDQLYIYLVSELEHPPMMNMSILDCWVNHQHGDKIPLPFGCSDLEIEYRHREINPETIQRGDYSILESYQARPLTRHPKPSWLTCFKHRLDEDVERILYTAGLTTYTHLAPIEPLEYEPFVSVDPIAHLSLQQALGKERVLVTGCFDLFHAGHVHFLNEVYKNYVGKDRELHVGIPDDTSVTFLKSRRPVYEWEYRKAVVESVSVVEKVHKFKVWKDAPDGTQGVEDGHRDLLNEVKPTRFVDSRQKPMERIGALPYLKEKGIPIYFVDSIDIHTTDILNLIKEGHGV